MSRGDGSIPTKFHYPSDTPGYVDVQTASLGVHILPRKGDYIRTASNSHVGRFLVESVEWDYTLPNNGVSVTVRTSRA